VDLEKILCHRKFLDLYFSSNTFRVITPNMMGWARGVKKGGGMGKKNSPRVLMAI